MPATTTIAAFKSALKTAILARTFISTNNVQVDYGEPGAAGRRETVWISSGLNDNSSDQVLRVMRKGAMEEDYNIHVFVENGTLPDLDQTEARVVLVADEVTAALIANNTMGGVSWVKLGQVDIHSLYTTDGPRSVLEMRLAVKARLGT